MHLLPLAIAAICKHCHTQTYIRLTKEMWIEKQRRIICVVESLLPGFLFAVYLLLTLHCSLFTVYNLYATRTTNRSVQWSLHFGSWMVCQMAFCFTQTFFVYFTYRSFIISIFFVLFVRSLDVFSFYSVSCKLYARQKKLLWNKHNTEHTPHCLHMYLLNALCIFYFSSFILFALIPLLRSPIFRFSSPVCRFSFILSFCLLLERTNVPYSFFLCKFIFNHFFYITINCMAVKSRSFRTWNVILIMFPFFIIILFTHKIKRNTNTKLVWKKNIVRFHL